MVNSAKACLKSLFARATSSATVSAESPLMTTSSITQLWITPRSGDETRWLLAWNDEQEQFELPTLSGADWDAATLLATAAKKWVMPREGLRIDPHPVARLPHAGEFHGRFERGQREVWSAAVSEGETHSHRTGLEWVSAKDVVMGFTSGGRMVDPQLRILLEKTGRLPRGRTAEQRVVTIGVTGHRDLVPDDIPVLFDKLHRAVEDLEMEFPGFQLQVMSPLGEGADQLLADVALERGIPISAPLPLPVAEYEGDFTTPEALEQFRETLGQARDWYCLPLVRGVSREDLQAQPGLRREHYANLGRYLVDHSDVLLAMWDGRTNGSAGGTAGILQYALQAHRRPGQRLLIRHIPTRRAKYVRE